jgi:ABC-type antimicrobial peptide transport system ATPase subunit
MKQLSDCCDADVACGVVHNWRTKKAVPGVFCTECNQSCDVNALVTDRSIISKDEYERLKKLDEKIRKEIINVKAMLAEKACVSFESRTIQMAIDLLEGLYK